MTSGTGTRCPLERDPMDELEATEFLVDKLRSTKNNADFFDSMRRG
jgi:transcription termination factor Rho